MAGQRGPTAVHIITILFGMASLILGVMTYISYREYARISNEVTTAREAQATFESQAERQREDIAALSRIIGFPGLDIGGGQPGETTVLGQFAEVLQTYGGNDQGASFDQTLDNMRAHINTLQANITQAQTQLDQQTQELLAAEGLGQDNIDTLIGRQTTDEGTLVQRINLNAEEIADLERDIDTWRGDLQRAQQEKEDLRDQLVQLREEGLRLITLLDDRIQALNDELNRLREVAFDIPHGHIVRVENVTQLVYIDIGSSDLLRPGVAFNVYVQNPRDNGRGPQDIKGSIEVVQILSNRQAEARVISEDHSRPISPGDPIYSPIWQAGVAEEFAFVGLMDLDDDGKSDWIRLEELVQLFGGRIEFYVDDEGNIQPGTGTVSEFTTYLVVGEIPNPDDFFGDPERQEIAANIQALHQRLTQDAQRYGVRVLRRNDFLTHIGWKPDLSGSQTVAGDRDHVPSGTAAVRTLLEDGSFAIQP